MKRLLKLLFADISGYIIILLLSVICLFMVIALGNWLAP